ncbi:MAG: glycosyltransferase family 39 protein [Acidobacteriota bacterium]
MRSKVGVSPCELSSRQRALWVLTAASIVVLVASAVVLAVRDDRASRLALVELHPVVASFVKAAAVATSSPSPLAASLGGACLALCLALAGMLLRRGRPALPSALLLLALGVAAAAQAALVLRSQALGAWLYAAVLTLLVVRWYAARMIGSQAGGLTPPACRRFSWLEAVGVFAVVALATLYRLYALNQLPSDFEGELTVEMVASTSIRSALEYSYVSNLTPSGLVYHLLQYVAFRAFGSTVLAVRLVPALVGVAAVLLLYGLLRRLAGVGAAFTGAIFLSVSPLEVAWSRSDVYPFGLPDLVIIGLCWVTYLAITTERWIWFLGVMVLQKLTYDLYPSGQMGVLIPVVLVGWWLLTVKGFARRCWRKTLLVGVGVGLWVVSLSLGGLIATGKWEWRSPLSFNAGKTLWSLPVTSSDGAAPLAYVAATAVRNAGELVRRVFVGVDRPTHYSPLARSTGQPARYVPAAVAVLVAVGLPGLLLSGRRDTRLLLLIWAGVALLPGVLSTDPEARRLATLFPALFAIAAWAAADAAAAVSSVLGSGGRRTARLIAAPAALGLFGIIMGGLYFATEPATPPVARMAQAIAELLRPGTLAVADIDPNYDTRNRVTFLLLDRLGDGRDPPAWRTVADGDWPEVAWHPRLDLTQFQYASSRLSERVPGLAARQRWSRCLFVIQELPGSDRKLELLASLFPDAPRVSRRPVPDTRGFDFVAVEVDWDAFAAVTSPDVTLVGGAGAAAAGAVPWLGREARTVSRPSSGPGAASVHAGLFVARQSWTTFRLSPSVPAALTLDGRPAGPHAALPLTRGVHRLDIRLDALPASPLSLLHRVEGEDQFSAVPQELIVAPGLADIGLLRAGQVASFPGFLPPRPVGTTPRGVFTHVAVSPGGRFASLNIDADGWTVTVLDREGRTLGHWARREPGRSSVDASAIAFVGDDLVAVLDRDVVARFDAHGRPLGDFKLPFEAGGEEDLAGSLSGGLFAVSGPAAFVAIVGQDGTEVGRLSPPPEVVHGRWSPMRVKAAPRGVVAVLDVTGALHVFRRGPSPGGVETGAWRWVRVCEPTWIGMPAVFSVREDGWVFAFYPDIWAWRVLDEAGVQHIAATDRDLDTLLRYNFTHLAGFDAAGNLWTWYDGTATAYRLGAL